MNSQQFSHLSERSGMISRSSILFEIDCDMIRIEFLCVVIGGGGSDGSGAGVQMCGTL